MSITPDPPFHRQTNKYATHVCQQVAPQKAAAQHQFAKKRLAQGVYPRRVIQLAELDSKTESNADDGHLDRGWNEQETYDEVHHERPKQVADPKRNGGDPSGGKPGNDHSDNKQGVDKALFKHGVE